MAVSRRWRNSKEWMNKELRREQKSWAMLDVPPMAIQESIFPNDLQADARPPHKLMARKKSIRCLSRTEHQAKIPTGDQDSRSLLHHTRMYDSGRKAHLDDFMTCIWEAVFGRKFFLHCSGGLSLIGMATFWSILG